MHQGLSAPAAILLAIAMLGTPAVVGAQTASAEVPPNLILPNYNRIPVGQREGIEAGAFLARTDDAGANWYNPAGLAKSLKSAVNASATAYEWTSTELEGLGAVSGRSRINTVGTLFSAVLGEGPLHSNRWRLGFSVARPIVWRPSSIDLSFAAPGDTERVAYATQADLDVTIPAVAVAFAPGGVGSGRFRLGASLGLAMTSIAQNQAISDRVTTATRASVRQKTFSTEGSSWDLKLSGGMQWDVTPGLTLGARLATPTFRVRGSSRVSLESMSIESPNVDDLVFRDAEASFEYRLPAEAELGAAVRGHAGEMEIDVHYYDSIDAYDMYSSTASGTLTVVDNTGTPTVTPVPLAPTVNSSKSVLNVAVGASHPLSEGLRVHAGFSSDRSPVPEGTQWIFRKVDLTRFTAGLSLSGSSLSGSLGFGYSFGSGLRQDIVTTEGGQPVDTQLKVRTVNLLFAISYSFKSP